MKAFILAAGRGRRLKPMTDKIPKPLVEVQDKPLLLHHLLALQKAGFQDIIINVSWLGDQIIDFLKTETPSGLQITISDERRQALETGGGMLKALSLLGDEPFLSINADVYTDFDFQLLKNQPLNNDLLHLLLVPNPEHNNTGDFSLKDHRLKHTDPNRTNYTYSGIGLYSPKLFINEQHRLNTAFRLAPLIHRAINKNRCSGQLYSGQWTDVGTSQRLAELNQ